MHNRSNVRLPEHIWETTQSQDELKQLIIRYVKKCYPGYTILEVKGRFAICEIPR
ncbi:hypothetical protein GCM10011346_52030 [Oceanobacillus neutriphilus]|uniref:Uncharacterized protein n=1 Tax=Oceanobacillus neutriphilus TaxID=531815 RepID=A0ABQ2P3D4_9BACI|nr:hypothetical protein GCM10011346_52030 [Oceanobacillus neutriphilus]